MDWPLNLFQRSSRKLLDNPRERSWKQEIRDVLDRAFQGQSLPGLYVVEGPALLALKELYNTEEIPVGIL